MRRAVLAAALFATVSAAAAYEVEVGFGGVHRTAAWTSVTVAGGGAAPGDTLFVWAEDPDGQFVRSPPGIEVTAAGGGPAWRFVVRFGRPSGRLRVERRAVGAAADATGEIVDLRLPEPIPSTTRIVLVAGDLPGAEAAVRIIAREDEPRPRLVSLTAGGPIATGGAARDFDAADAIVVCGSAVERLAADVRRGIDAWVRLGGRLVFVAGGSAAELPADAAAWLPAPVTRLATLERFGGLETHARAGRLPPRVAAGVRVPLFAAAAPLPGIVDVWEGPAGTGTPLVVRRCHGLGTIAWLGVDLDAPVFRDWQGAAPLLAGLLGGRAETVDQEAGGLEASRDGDLAGQLRTALERFPPAGVAPVSFELVAAIGLLYVLCLYPIDWWLVSRSGGRPWVARLTLAAFVAAFTGLAWGVHAARQPAAGERPTCAAEMVDFDAAGGTVRGRGWAAIQSVDNDRLGVDVAVDEAAADVAVSWWGDAGRGFAAVDAGMPHPSLAAADYAYRRSLAVLAGVPIAASSSRLFEADWQAEREPGSIATADLAAGPQGTLTGGVAQHLPFPLEGCRLVHGGWLYDVGRLEPGQRYDTAAGRGPRSLAAALTRRAAAKERDVAVRWNPAEADAERILEVAGFHAAAGGEGYTGRPGGRLGRLDLSAVVGLDRAVLVGFTSRGQATWNVAGGRATARGLYRIVIPVAPAAAGTER
jgi:hypothetical protein